MKEIENLRNAARMGAAMGVCSALMMLGAVMTACGESGSGAEMEAKGQWQDGVETVRFALKGDFAVTTEAMTRAHERSGTRGATRATAQEAGMTDVWVMDYMNEGTEQEPVWTLTQQVHQGQTDEGFGSPVMQLKYGQHRMVIVAAKGDGAALAFGTTEGHEGEGTLAWTKVKDTFAKDYALEVVSGMSGSVNVTLERTVGAMKLLIKDVVPENAKTIEITTNRIQKLLLPSLAMGEPQASTVTAEVPASWIGKKDVSVTTYTLCNGSDGVTTDVSIVVKDAGQNVISNILVENVTIELNKLTVLKGEIFGRNNAISISLSTDWDAEENVVEF